MATSIGVKLGIDGENEYRKALKNIVEQTKTLDKQMAALESSFDDETDAMEKNEKQTELLQKKAEKLSEEIDMMKDMVEKAAEMYGESSDQCQKWEQALATAETELNNTNAAIEEHQEAAEEAGSALGQLTAEIESQSAELDDLKTAYINAVLEFGEGSEEAEILAGEIQNLSGELYENKSALDAARGMADELTTAMDNAGEATEDIGEDADAALGMFSPAMAGIITAAASGDLLGAIGGVAEAVQGIADAAINIADEYDEAMGVIAIGTDTYGPKLDEMTTKAKQMWAALKDEDFSLEDAANTVAALNTRLGDSVADSTEANMAVNEFATVTGVDTTTAVNGLVDVMKRWGLANGDTETTVTNLVSICDMLMQAQANADVPVTTLMNSLSSQAGAMDILGISMEGGIGLMTSYRDAGGDVSDITAAMTRAQKNLNDETDDVPAAWQNIIDILQGSGSTYEKVNTEIGDLGVTVEEVLGDKLAGKLASTFTSSTVDIDGFTESVKNISGTLEALYENSRTASDQFSTFGRDFQNNMYDIVTGSKDSVVKLGSDANYWAQKYMATDETLNKIHTGQIKLTGNVDSAYSDMATGVGSSATEMANSVEVGTNDAAASFDDMGSEINGTLSGITGDVNTAHTSWANTIGGTIYGPKITAPTISYTKGSDGSMTPRATYHTYARAYGHALELSGASIFGMAGNSMLMGGEKAGAEVVVGESHLMDMFQESVRNAIGYAGNGGLASIEGLLREYLPHIGNDIYLDTGALVGSTAPAMNMALGRISARSERGGR